MRIRIVMEVHDEHADEGHDCGLREGAFSSLLHDLMRYGYDIEIDREVSS